MVAIISGPDVSGEVEKVVRQNNLKISLNKVDLDIDLINEIEKIKSMSIDLLILDLACVDDVKRVPMALNRLKSVNDSIRIILIAHYNFSKNSIMSDIISMQVYDIIGHSDGKIAEALNKHIQQPATYAQAVGWDMLVKTIENAKETGKKSTDENRKFQGQVFGRVVIAVAGTIPRIGTTHTVISIARYFLQNRYPVAAVELTENGSFEAIKDSYDNVRERDGMFSLGGIDFYPFNPNFSISDLLQEDYKYIVVDMGVYSKCNKFEFSRAQERIIVSGVKDWEFEPLEILLDTESKLDKNKYYFTFSDDSMFEIVKYSMGTLECFKAPYNPQPFNESDEFDKVIEDMLHEVIAEVHDRTEEDNGFGNVVAKVDKIIHRPILVDRMNREDKRASRRDPAVDFFSKYKELFRMLSNVIVISVILTFIYLVLDKSGILMGLKEIVTGLQTD